MKKFYLFGAGVNGYGVIKFFGDVFIDVVDNNPEKVGSYFCGYVVISFGDFLEKWHGETVIVSSYTKSEDIVKQLNEFGVHSVYVAPFMQNGYWKDCDEIVEAYELLSKEKIAIEGHNPLCDLLIECLVNGGSEAQIIILEREAIRHSIMSDIVILTELLEENTILVDNNDNVIDVTSPKYIYRTNLLKYKNIHSGKSCFIIGNGPSLRCSDLDRLYDNNVVCFASNGIYKIYGDTKWRPTYYVISDFVAWRNLAQYNAENELGSDVFFLANSYNNKIPLPEKTEIYNLLPFKYERDRVFSEDIAKFISSGGTVTYVMIQIAVYMGFSEIYLLGIDFTNTGHFYKDESTVSTGTMMWRAFTGGFKYMKEAYDLAEDYACKHELSIINVTRGGQLEVFKRLNFDRVMDNWNKGE